MARKWRSCNLISSSFPDRSDFPPTPFAPGMGQKWGEESFSGKLQKVTGDLPSGGGWFGVSVGREEVEGDQSPSSVGVGNWNKNSFKQQLPWLTISGQTVWTPRSGFADRGARKRSGKSKWAARGRMLCHCPSQVQLSPEAVLWWKWKSADGRPAGWA